MSQRPPTTEDSTRTTAQSEPLEVLLLISNQSTRDHLIDLLKRNDYRPMVMLNPNDLLDTLKEQARAIVFVDDEAVSIYGVRIYSKIKVACQWCRIIMLCDQAHRDLIKEAMEVGVYGCIIEPYAEWEVLNMVGYVVADQNSRKGPKSRKGRKT